ncbi:hypothetical protein [Cellulomonas aerilata]|nr:hypothetical protein [Cellulomonas aerilata]
MHHRVAFEGRTLVVERPYSARPRLLADGAELPKDHVGRYLLPDQHGTPRTIEVGFDLKNLAPRLQIGAQRVLTAAPLPKAAWMLLAPAVVLGLLGGALGAILGITAAVLAAHHLRSRRWPDVARALGIELAAVLVYLGVATLVRML